MVKGYEGKRQGARRVLCTTMPSFSITLVNHQRVERANLGRHAGEVYEYVLAMVEGRVKGSKFLTTASLAEACI